MNIIGSVSEGFHNVPRIYGSEVRTPGHVDGIKSGFKEGAKVNHDTAQHTITHESVSGTISWLLRCDHWPGQRTRKRSQGRRFQRLCERIWEKL